MAKCSDISSKDVCASSEKKEPDPNKESISKLIMLFKPPQVWDTLKYKVTFEYVLWVRLWCSKAHWVLFYLQVVPFISVTQLWSKTPLSKRRDVKNLPTIFDDNLISLLPSRPSHPVLLSPSCSISFIDADISRLLSAFVMGNIRITLQLCQ